MIERHSILITLSGIDGAGKSTQMVSVTDYLKGHGRRYVTLWSRPGYTDLLNTLKNVLRKTSQRKLPSSGNSRQRDQLMQKKIIRRIWITAALLDLWRVYGLVIRFRLWRGYTVICDRFINDALIDLRLWFPHDNVEQWWLWRLLSLCTPRPDLAYYLTIPLAESEKRCQLKYEPFPDSTELRAKRYKEYQKLFSLVPGFRIDCTAPLEEVKTLVLEILQQKIANRNG